METTDETVYGWAVAVGNAFEGLRLFGAFEDVEAALDWAETNRVERDEWHLVKIEVPV